LVPKGADTVNTDVPRGGTVTVVELNEGRRGVGGEAARDTWPVKPPVGVTVMVELFEAPPATRVRKCWLAPKTIAWPVTVT
jgi:hypothetical protein